MSIDRELIKHAIRTPNESDIHFNIATSLLMIILYYKMQQEARGFYKFLKIFKITVPTFLQSKVGTTSCYSSDRSDNKPKHKRSYIA